jgi:hypothetical protein
MIIVYENEFQVNFQFQKITKILSFVYLKRWLNLYFFTLRSSNFGFWTVRQSFSDPLLRNSGIEHGLRPSRIRIFQYIA